MTECVRVDLVDMDVLRNAVEEQLSAGGILVRSARVPTALSSVCLEVCLPDKEILQVEGIVVGPSPGGGGFFVVLNEGMPRDQLLERASACLEEFEASVVIDLDDENWQGPATSPETVEPISSAALDSDAEPEQQAPENPGEMVQEDAHESGPASPKTKTTRAPRAAWELIDPRSDVPLHRQLAALSVSDKLRLARQANRPVRRILIRDMEKRIHVEVIKNPKTTDEELVEYAAISSLSPRAVRLISEKHRLVRRRDMSMNLVLNPSCPHDVATRIMGRMSPHDLHRVMHSSKVRETVKREARKRLMQAGII